MEAENSLGNFNRTRSPEKKLSYTPYKEETFSEKKPLSSGRDYKDRYGEHGCCRHGTSKGKRETFDSYYEQDWDIEGYEDLGDCMLVCHNPCNLDTEREFLNEASRKCIAKYNKKHRKAPNYEFMDVVMANKQRVSGYNYYITFRARQIGLPDDMVKTFRAEYYCKFNGTNGRVSEVVKRG